MGNEITGTIAIRYLLNEDGRRAAIKGGGVGTALQTIVAVVGDSLYGQALELATVSEDGTPYLTVGYQEIGKPFHDVPNKAEQIQIVKTNHEGQECVRHRIVMWSEVQDAAGLLDWETQRRLDVERAAAAEKERESAKETQRKAAQAREHEAEQAQKRSRRDEKLAALAEVENGLSSDEAADEKIADAVVQTRRCIRDGEWQWDLHRAQKTIADFRSRAEQKRWIAEHGSDRLRRCVAEDIECYAIYRDERLAVERPGWLWRTDVRGEGDEPRNPPLEAFALLDEARKVVPEAALRYWTIETYVDEDGNLSCEKEEKTEFWRGYAAITQFLDREVVFFGDQDVPE